MARKKTAARRKPKKKQAIPPYQTPQWVEQTEAYLHDARRNLMGYWSLIRSVLTRKGFQVGHHDGMWNSKDLKRLKHPRLRKLVRLMQDWEKVESGILDRYQKADFSAEDEDYLSQSAQRLLDIHKEMRDRAPFLKSLVQSYEEGFYFESFQENHRIVSASLKPLVEKKSRQAQHRFGLKLSRFIGDYSKRRFRDREGRTVRPVFKVRGNPTLKTNREIFTAQLNNLVQDAINHNPPAPIQVEIFQRNAWVVIKVVNPGKKIPESRLKLIGHDAYWSRGKGRLRGRGKISVRLFCEDHGGKLKVYNSRRNKKHYGPALQMVLPAA